MGPHSFVQPSNPTNPTNHSRAETETPSFHINSRTCPTSCQFTGPNCQAAHDSIVQLPPTLLSSLHNLETPTSVHTPTVSVSSLVPDLLPAERNSVRQHALRTRWKQNRPTQACLAVSFETLRYALGLQILDLWLTAWSYNQGRRCLWQDFFAECLYERVSSS